LGWLQGIAAGREQLRPVLEAGCGSEGHGQCALNVVSPNPGQSAYAEIEFRKAVSEIKNPDGSIVFRLEDIDVPEAVEPGRGRHSRPEVLPQGRRAARLKKVEENDVPSWLWRSVADDRALAALPEAERYGS
jgi:ribonucleoside-diphosphate reductase alpha chain